jgi:hypothetical protein
MTECQNKEQNKILACIETRFFEKAGFSTEKHKGGE